MTIHLITALMMLLPMGASVPSDADHKATVEEWHGKRVERLHSKTGWLSLAGLFPIAEGRNTFGSSEENEIVFPEGAPARAGTIWLSDDNLRIHAETGARLTCKGEPVTEMSLLTDHDENTTVIELGAMQFYVIKRPGNYYIRLKDGDSKLLTSFDGIDRFPVNKSWRVVAKFETYDPPKKVIVPNVVGYESESSCPGAAVFEIDGKTCRLEPTGDPAGELFFVFADETSELETYGGGRFLYAGPPKDGTIVLDFNKAYNPPCVFTPYATCPLPLPENILTVRVEAGEKTFSSH